ncbi:MAG: ribonuclease III [Gammaproteobacteria bacterium]|nr:ribonuclease III [Gammaproteobacteria bacterium]
MTLSPALNKLINKLDYRFDNENFLLEALTHRSASSKNNERMEFLGDSILNFVIASELFESYPEYDEGDLSRLRANLVKKEGLAKVAHDLDLGEYIVLGSGELKSGGHRRDSILADTVEAIIGAVYLDGGFEAGKQLILKLYNEQLNNLPDIATLKDPKTRLQELLQGQKMELPVYQVLSIQGKAHQQTFHIQCHIKELDITTDDRASSRRKAEQLVAERAIQEIQARRQKSPVGK